MSVEDDLAYEFTELHRVKGLQSCLSQVQQPVNLTKVCGCGEEIGDARLAANPKAVDCIDCAREADRVRRHPHLKKQAVEKDS